MSYIRLLKTAAACLPTPTHHSHINQLCPRFRITYINNFLTISEAEHIKKQNKSLIQFEPGNITHDQEDPALTYLDSSSEELGTFVMSLKGQEWSGLT